MKSSGFTHLHLHTDASLLDGQATPKRYVERAQKLGMTHLAVTDHGNVCNAPSFYKACRDAEIEPVLGEEFYFVPDNAKYVEMKGERFHISILARGERGFKVLSDLSTEAHRNYHYKPCIDRSIIEGLSKKDRASLVVMSGCAGSIISRILLGEEPGNADKEVKWWKKMFCTGNYFIELMHHDTSFDVKLNMGLIDLARRHDLPWVITNDPHFTHKNDACHHDALLAIQTGSNLDDPDRFRFEGKGYWLRTEAEIQKAFKRYGKEIWKPGIKQTNIIAQDCHTRISSWEKTTWHIPVYPFVEDATAEVERLIRKGLKKRGLDKNKKYVKRAKREMKAFGTVKTPNGAGMSDFLLITLDAITEARSLSIPVGPGRGSVCGTLVGYLIGVHKMDSIKYDLLFERFFNPERPKMPDVDTDYSAWFRDKILAYFPERYGEGNTAPVAAFGTMQARRGFQSLARVNGIDYKQSLRLSGKILEDEEGNTVWPSEIKEKYPDIIDGVNALLGLKASLSSHPAGVVIFDPKDPIKDLCPEMWIPDRDGKPGRFVMQYNLAAVDLLMLLKQDTLGLRALDTIAECVRLVEERHGVKLDPDSWVPDDEPDDKGVYKMLARGECEGVFQMEGGTNHMGIQKINPDRFEDIVTCTSLYRAGPMVAGAPARFLANKKDKKVRVLHPALEPHLARSWGEMIYQEQMFSILNEVAGLSWSRVDDAKTATSKKNATMMAAVKEDAVKGFIANDIPEQTAEKIWKMIASQSLYLFNRSHAVAYSFVTYQTARLKHLYPLEFYAALLRTVEGKSKEAKAKREGYMKAAVRAGFRLMPPEINLSDDRFVPNGDDELLFGLVDIKNIGPAVYVKIMEHRAQSDQKLAFNSTETVAKVLGTRDRTKGAYRHLAACGALRNLGVEPDEEAQTDLLGFQFADNMIEMREQYGEKIKRPKGHNSKCLLYGEIVKTEKRKTRAGRYFYVWLIRWAAGEEYTVNLWDDASSLFPLQKGSIVRVRGNWQSSYSNVSVSDPSQVKIYKKVVIQTTDETPKGKK